jgi:succinate dehydrogenase / fumarate reductase cytochrome b subunit
MHFFKSTVGRKIILAISGQMMVLFVVAHLLGNSTIFVPGGINAYAGHLHNLTPLVWTFRLLLLVMVISHIYFGILITLENRAAKPLSYAVNKRLKTTFAGENMIWSGVLLALFIIGHILHFTARLTPDISSRLSYLSRGDLFDVHSMVVGSFQHGVIASIYMAAMGALFLHMFHGIQSFFQTMGLNNERTMPVIIRAGRTAAFIFLIGYASIPLFILLRILT